MEENKTLERVKWLVDVNEDDILSDLYCIAKMNKKDIGYFDHQITMYSIFLDYLKEYEEYEYCNKALKLKKNAEAYMQMLSQKYKIKIPQPVTYNELDIIDLTEFILRDFEEDFDTLMQENK